MSLGPDSEVRQARRAARRVGLTLEVVHIPRPSPRRFHLALYHLEQPDAATAWAMAPAVLTLGRHLRARGIRVALSGEGADELFGGYAWDRLQAAVERNDGSPIPEDARRLLGPRASHFRLQHSMAGLRSSSIRARDVWMSVASGGVDALVAQHLDGWLLDSPPPPRERPVVSPPRGARHRQLYGLQHDMLTLPVVHADRLLMASGVEARMPFLDHRVVELALRLSPEVLEVAGSEKAVLRTWASRWLPGFTPPPKRGFTAQATPSPAQIHALASSLREAEPLVVRRAVWRRTAKWTDPIRLHALWRLVVLETTAQLLLSDDLLGKPARQNA